MKIFGPLVTVVVTELLSSKLDVFDDNDVGIVVLFVNSLIAVLELLTLAKSILKRGTF